ncbi:hypothetical protein C7212DRAFT_367143 [Tuber magnatum]|uniref:RCC1-like domain-containing protein n=1 Tax=Tuber magnatum TaxID=42249 RepID=A0A317SAQ3_9PEZI|nr:hypothetical protein C7212DRAFT_367143 [Tuber magnatum]
MPENLYIGGSDSETRTSLKRPRLNTDMPCKLLNEARGADYEAGTTMEIDTDLESPTEYNNVGSYKRRRVSRGKFILLPDGDHVVADGRTRQRLTPNPGLEANADANPEASTTGAGYEAAELGPGPEVKARVVMRPRLNAHLHHKKVGIVAIAAGGTHGPALSHEGMVYSWGVNDRYALGRVTQYTPPGGDGDPGSNSDSDELLNALESTPRLIVAFPEGTVITNIAAGDSISIAVTNTGRIYAWGTFQSSEGILGFNKRIHIQPVPKLLDTPKDVVQVACGTDHVLALTERGEVYTWGNGEHWELGTRIVPSTHLPQLNPTRVIAKGVGSVAAGSYHSFAIDRDGKVWSWGLNQYAQCGIDGGDTIRSPTLVMSLTNYRIKQMSTGEHHTAALTDDGQLLVWGRVDDGRLGLDLAKVPATDVVRTWSGATVIPHHVRKPHALPGTSFTSIACSTHHSIAISTEGHAFIWGIDVCYQTGHGPHNGRGEAIRTPT